MDIVQVLCQSANSHNRSVRDILALGKDEISKSGSSRNDASDCVIADMLATCKIQNSKGIKD
jgi:hypothetical protein